MEPMVRLRLLDTLRKIWSDISSPSDQRKDWYGWASNQMSHAFFGMSGVILFGVLGTALIAVIKEANDFRRAPSLRTGLDCFVDLSFWGYGAILYLSAANPWPITLVALFALSVGIYVRARG